MDKNKTPTTQQLFGAYNKIFELAFRQPPRRSDEWDSIRIGMHLGHEEPGVLTMIGLRGDAAAAYRELEGKWRSATHWGRRGSEDSLKQILHRFLLEMAIASDTARTEVKRRCIAELEAQVGGNSRRWRVVVRAAARLYGPDEASLCGIRFRNMTEDQRRRMRAQIQRDLGVNKRHAQAMTDEFKQLVGRDVICDVKVEARDAAHAFLVAQEFVTDRLEVIAGITALIRKPSDQKNDPRRRSGPGIAIELGTGSGKGLGFGTAPDEVDLTAIVGVMKEPRVRRLLRLLDKKVTTEGERRLLAALRWSGRSRRADSETSAYLYAMIAYEALLGSDRQLGISYSLRLRHALIVASRRMLRRSLFRSSKDLYSRRSSIVHTGANGVEPDELIALWRRLNQVMLAYIDRKFYRRTNADINQWFEDQIL